MVHTYTAQMAVALSAVTKTTRTYTKTWGRRLRSPSKTMALWWSSTETETKTCSAAVVVGEDVEDGHDAAEQL
jgi:predicted solute-binding protein